MALGDKLNEQKNKPSTSITAIQELEQHVIQSERGLENSILKKALIESKIRYEELSNECLKSVKENNQAIQELKNETALNREEYKNLTKNIAKTIQDMLHTQISSSLDNVAKSAKNYCQTVVDSSMNATKAISSLQYLIIGGFMLLIVLSGFSFYKVYSLTSANEELIYKVNNILIGDQKYW